MYKNPPAPPALIKAWYNNLVQNESKEAQQRAKQMLLQVFGSEEAILKHFVSAGLIKKKQ